MKNPLKAAWSYLFKSDVLVSPEDREKEAAKELQKRRALFAEGVRKALDAASTKVNTKERVRFPLTPYTPPPGVCPATQVLANDRAWENLATDTSFVLGVGAGGMFGSSGMTASVLDGMGFPGFPYLTELTQLTEYRDMSERTAAEMTRKWIKFRSISDDKKEERIAILEREFRRHKIRDLSRQAVVLDGQMGRAQVFIDLADSDNEELTKPLMLNKYKILKGSLKGFKIVEPITTYPAAYNSSDPLASDYYVPSAWFVYGQKVHATRLLTYVSRPLPDLLKPVYNFSGMSLSQLAQPYVDYWFSTRDSVGNLLRNFSTTVLKTNLDVLLGPSGQELINRMELFTKNRDNQGIFLINKEQEELAQLNTPLSGLDKLQAQAQEHMASVAKTPLVILLGITPSGLNASAEGDIRIYYDYVADQQEILLRSNLETMMKVIMLDQFGEVDDEITFDFNSLFALTGKEEALIRKSDTERDQALVQMGAISPEEVRSRVAKDPASGYDDIDVDQLPPAPPPMPAGGGKKSPQQESSEATENAEFNSSGDVAQDLLDAADVLAKDGGFRGNQHTGGFSDDDEPGGKALRLSGLARKASTDAGKLGTRAAHQAAVNAHGRALVAHRRALSSADPEAARVHEAYCDAHRFATSNHRAAMRGE